MLDLIISNIKFIILPPEHLYRDTEEVKLRTHSSGASWFVSQATFYSTLNKIQGFFLRKVVLKIQRVIWPAQSLYHVNHLTLQNAANRRSKHPPLAEEVLAFNDFYKVSFL